MMKDRTQHLRMMGFQEEEPTKLFREYRPLQSKKDKKNESRRQDMTKVKKRGKLQNSIYLSFTEVPTNDQTFISISMD